MKMTGCIGPQMGYPNHPAYPENGNAISALKDKLTAELYETSAKIPALYSFTELAVQLLKLRSCLLAVQFPCGNIHNAQAYPASALLDHGQDQNTFSWDERTPIIATLVDGYIVIYVRNFDADRHAITIRLSSQYREIADAAPLLEIASSLSLHLPHSFKIYRKISELARMGRAANIALSTNKIGMILVSQEGKIIFANDVANALLAEEDCLFSRHGKITSHNSKDMQLLYAEIERCSRGQSQTHDRALFSPLALGRRSSGTPLTILVRPGPDFGPIQQPLLRSALLILRDPKAPLTSTSLTLARLFGLTVAESNVAKRIYSGESIDNIAKETGVSKNTVKSQLQSIFSKVGVNKQTDLVRLILSSTATST